MAIPSAMRCCSWPTCKRAAGRRAIDRAAGFVAQHAAVSARGTGNLSSAPRRSSSAGSVFLAWSPHDRHAQSRIASALRQNYVLWNSVLFFTFVAAFLLVWMIPLFGLGFFLLLLAYIGPMTAYILYRNSKVPAEKRILTPDHLRHWYAERVKKFGVQVSPEKKVAKKEGPPVQFTPQGAKTDRENTANLLLSKQSPGWPVARELIADVFDHRADAVMLEYQQTGVGVRYQIDGVWHNSEPRERETGDPMLAVFKTVSALNANQRQAKQEGTFGVEFKGQKPQLQNNQPRRAHRRARDDPTGRHDRSNVDVRRSGDARQDRRATERGVGKAQGIRAVLRVAGRRAEHHARHGDPFARSLHARRGGGGRSKTSRARNPERATHDVRFWRRRNGPHRAAKVGADVSQCHRTPRSGRRRNGQISLRASRGRAARDLRHSREGKPPKALDAAC